VKEYVLTLLVTAAVTYLLTPLVRRLAIKVRAVPQARDRDVHQVPTPRLGGIAMFGGLAAGLLVASRLDPLREVFAGTKQLSALLLASALIVVVGVIDDRWGMNAIGKLAGQVAAAAVLAFSGVQLDSFPLPNHGTLSLTPDESLALTILVVVATINAVNFIDGLDGLAAGIVCIAAVAFFSYYYSLTKVLHLSAEAVPALASVVLAGVCIGFLPHNFFPARIFMGDTGAMLLGLLLAYVPISAISSVEWSVLTDYSRGPVNRFPAVLPLLLPAAVLVIPYADMLRAVVRRARAGRPLFSPDRLHLHHRLLDIGHSHRSSVLILYLWAALFAGPVVALSILRTPLLALAGMTLAAVLALLLMSMPRLRWWERKLQLAGTAMAEGGAAPRQSPTVGVPQATTISGAGDALPDGRAATEPVALAAGPGPAAFAAGPGPAEPVALRAGPGTTDARIGGRPRRPSGRSSSHR
jgi:UDP-GlcNAc:undecaprenyl-phosphate GlcNAc-1-phosphate transferase